MIFSAQTLPTGAEQTPLSSNRTRKKDIQPPASEENTNANSLEQIVWPHTPHGAAAFALMCPVISSSTEGRNTMPV